MAPCLPQRADAGRAFELTAPGACDGKQIRTSEPCCRTEQRRVIRRVGITVTLARLHGCGSVRSVVRGGAV